MSQTAPKSEPARKMLGFDNVELYYDHVYALKGVSLAVANTGIDGASGATVSIVTASPAVSGPRLPAMS